MSCCRRRRIESVPDEVESIRSEGEVESEVESFRGSRCFLVIWRDRSGRKRCKCCCRRRTAD